MTGGALRPTPFRRQTCGWHRERRARLAIPGWVPKRCGYRACRRASRDASVLSNRSREPLHVRVDIQSFGAELPGRILLLPLLAGLIEKEAVAGRARRPAPL